MLTMKFIGEYIFCFLKTLIFKNLKSINDNYEFVIYFKKKIKK